MKGYLVLLLIVASFGRLLAGEPATAVATITAGFVTGLTVTSGGSGYTSEPAVIFSGGGGSGATAKAILSGDKVAVVVVLTARSGYSGQSAVSIETPPRKLNLALEMIPKLTVAGPPGSLAQVEWAGNVSGPWAVWSKRGGERGGGGTGGPEARGGGAVLQSSIGPEACWIRMDSRPVRTFSKSRDSTLESR
jgi:hypothetical protein